MGRAILKRKAGAAAVLALCMLTATACAGASPGSGSSNGSGDGAADREVIKKPDKTITVIDTKPAVPADREMEVTKIDMLKGIRGMDWLSGDRIIISKENVKAKPVTIEGEKRYPTNLYIRDLIGSGKVDEPLKEESANQSFAQLSPDRKHLFYKKNNEDTATGYIMDLATRKSLQTGEGELHAADGQWIDNERVVFPLIAGSIVTADIHGGAETVIPMKSFSVSNVTMRGNILYYTNRGILYAYDTHASKKPEPLDKNVVWFIPSPDGKQFAIVRRISDTEMELTVTDSELKQKFTLGKGTQVFGTSWSPDGSKLAYTVMSQDEEGVSGMFVADALSGKTTQISVDVQFGTGDPFRWSPEGNKLMTSAVVLQDSKYSFNTYIISF